MQLTPRYGADPVITIDGRPAAIAEPAIRQRRRLAEVVAGFDDAQWAHPTRCEGWTSRSVISHLDTTNGFWVYAIAAGVRGEPSEMLAEFDPVATPAALVAATEAETTAAVLERFLASNQALIDQLASLDDANWSAPAEAPPGHLSVSALVHHALWDAWIHERDILLPMGRVPIEHNDEIVACLRYAAALGPAFACLMGQAEGGVLVVESTDPSATVVVDIGESVAVRAGEGDEPGDLRLRGGAVGLVEALSLRQPLDQPVPPELAWMVGGLATVFDADPV